MRNWLTRVGFWRDFEAPFDLRINLEKSLILLEGEIRDYEGLALELGCKDANLLSSYLGLPLGASHKFLAVWDGIEEKYRKRLALWKWQYISKGGRLTLIKSVLSNTPMYYLSLLRISRKVKLRLERIRRDFLLGVRLY